MARNSPQDKKNRDFFPLNLMTYYISMVKNK